MADLDVCCCGHVEDEHGGVWFMIGLCTNWRCPVKDQCVIVGAGLCTSYVSEARPSERPSRASDEAGRPPGIRPGQHSEGSRNG